MLPNEVPLDELEQPFDLPLRSGPARVHGLDPKPPGGVLGVGLADRMGGLELALPIREEGLGQPPRVKAARMTVNGWIRNFRRKKPPARIKRL